MNFLWKKVPNPPPWGRWWAQNKSSRAARSGSFQRKIKTVDKDSHWLTWVLGWRRSFNNFIDSSHFFGSNWGQSYLVTLVTQQNCTKCLEILILFHNLHILASDQTSCFFFSEQLSLQKATLIVFWATSEQLFKKLGETFWNNLEQLVESPKCWLY